MPDNTRHCTDHPHEHRKHEKSARGLPRRRAGEARGPDRQVHCGRRAAGDSKHRLCDSNLFDIFSFSSVPMSYFEFDLVLCVVYLYIVRVVC